jgi:hypothetical protein
MSPRPLPPDTGPSGPDGPDQSPRTPRWPAVALVIAIALTLGAFFLSR